MSIKLCCNTKTPCEKHACAQHQEVLPARPRNEEVADLIAKSRATDPEVTI